MVLASEGEEAVEKRRVLSEAVVRELADALWNAEVTRTAIAPLTETVPRITVDDAYEIQLVNVRRRLEQGARTVGKKIGLTSKAMQRQLQVDQPDYGHLLDTMCVAEGDLVSLSQFLQVRTEPEIAFIMGKQLAGPGVTVAGALAAIDSVLPALEIIDSRIRDWKIRLEDTVADNASSCRVVCGGHAVPIRTCDWRLAGMVFERNGEIVDTGAGAAVLGNPVHAVVWLANKLAEFGAAIEPGDLVLPGSLCASIPVKTGDVVAATFDHLGTVRVRFGS